MGGPLGVGRNPAGWNKGTADRGGAAAHRDQVITIQPDVKAFREATKDVHKKYAEKWEPHFYERIQEVK